MAPEVDAAARVVFAEASLAADAPKRLRSGQIARVTIAPPLASATP